MLLSVDLSAVIYNLSVWIILQHSLRRVDIVVVVVVVVVVVRGMSDV